MISDSRRSSVMGKGHKGRYQFIPDFTLFSEYNRVPTVCVAIYSVTVWSIHSMIPHPTVSIVSY